MSKTLVIFRHFHAQPASIVQNDSQRPLSSQGLSDFENIKEILQQFIFQPSLTCVCYSDTIRTTQSAQLIKQACNIEYSFKKQYLRDGDFQAFLMDLSQLYEQFESIIIVAHYPEVSTWLEIFTQAKIVFDPGGFAMVKLNQNQLDQSTLLAYISPQSKRNIT